MTNRIVWRFFVILALLAAMLPLAVTAQSELPPQLMFIANGVMDDFADVGDYVHPDFAWYSNGALIGEGQEGFVNLMMGYYAMFPDLEMELMSFVADDAGIAYHAILHGTHTGEVEGMPAPTGNTLTMHYNSLMELDEDGLMTSIDMGFDGIEWAEALGMLPDDFAFMPEPMENLEELAVEDLPDALAFFFDQEAVLNPELATEYVSPDFAWYSNGHDYQMYGVEGFVGLMSGYYYLFPDMVSYPVTVVANDDYDLVAVRAIGTGTHLGEMPEVLATGNELYFDYTMLFRLDDDGKIIENWAGFDNIVWQSVQGLPLVNMYDP